MKVDLLSSSTFAGGHPFEYYRWLREHDPVSRHEEPDGPGFWAVTRHRDVRYVGRHAELFSNEPTITIKDMRAVDAKAFIALDAPQHTQLRGLVVPAFVPKAVKAIVPRLQQLASEIVDAVVERGECDLVHDVAGPMASYVTGDLLGIPHKDALELYALIEIVNGNRYELPEGEWQRATRGMTEYAHDVWVDRLAHPGDDVCSKLANGDVDGRRLSELEFAMNFVLLVDGGGDTTRNVIAGGMLALFEHPDERARLQADLAGAGTLMASAVEEMARWVSPVLVICRRAKVDTVLGERRIAAGDKVAVYFASANRDEDAFVEPDRFDVGRRPNDHVAFGGGGPHFCLGAHLARAEIDAMIRELLTRMPDIELAGPVHWLEAALVCGPKHLPVRFTRALVAGRGAP